MGVANMVINHPDEYRAIVNQHPLVCVLFIADGCEACKGADERFEQISSKYTNTVKSMVLNVGHTPQIKELGPLGTPTLIFYEDGKEIKRVRGIGFPEDQEEYLEDAFKHCALHAPIPDSPQYLSL